MPLTVKEKEQEALYRRDRFYASIGLDRVQVRKKIVRALPKPLGRVLEVGTGKGALTRVLAREADQVISVDLSAEEQVFAAEALAQDGLRAKVSLQLADAVALPFSNALFDTVVCAFSFHHFAAPFRAIDEMLRSSAGCVALVEFNAAGFEAVDRAHYLEGHTHEKNGISFEQAEQYFRERGVLVRAIHDEWFDMYIVKK